MIEEVDTCSSPDDNQSIKKDNATDTNASDKNIDDANSNDDYRMFECNICLDTAKDPVVSLCGHLYCWPCLHQWLVTRPRRQICPVCKAGINKNKVVPLYGRGCENTEDPRTKSIPSRPAGTRSEPDNSDGIRGFTIGDNFHISLGIGAYPFEFFSSLFNFGTNLNFPTMFDVRVAQNNNDGSIFSRVIPTTEDEVMQHFFLWIGVLFIIWLIIA